MSYYIAPAFLKTVSLHITKNLLDLPNVRVPLILGIHGRKGEGKSFQCDLVFEQMKVQAFHISAGELESPDAGDPARMLRLRYREASEQIRKMGQMCVLMINDLDAGAGRMNAMTQYTVNTQMVNVTLMNIADNPTNVQLPGSYDPTPLARVPIIVTGNDFSTLYAPLIRDGRMYKYHWDPTRADRIGILKGIFEPDQLSDQQIEQLFDRFPNQSVDFFGAIRAQLYDDQIWQMIQTIGVEKIFSHLLKTKGARPTLQSPQASLDHLIAIGERIQGEQRQVEGKRLSQEYLGLQQNTVPPPHPIPPQPDPHLQITPDQPELVSQPKAQENHGSRLSHPMQQQIQQILGLGHEIGIEHVDKRRYRVNSWQSCGFGHLRDPEQASTALAQCLIDYPGDYVRLVDINPVTKKRVGEIMVQRPS
jgi:ribulose bisphosphate carboxylase small subunit